MYSNDSENYTAFQPTERVIILRLDDVQGYSWRNETINLTDTVLAHNMSITLSVIPDSKLDLDSESRHYLIEKSKDSRVEIAQHGLKHKPYEFLNFNETEAYNAILSGSNDLTNLLRVKPVTFIPPYNSYNKNTTIALSKLNFSIISADRDEYGFADNLAILGYNAETKKTSDTELTPIPIILNKCNTSLNEKNICVIMVHVQDYVEKNGNMNNTKYNEFVKLLNSLKSLNAKSITFKDLIGKSINGQKVEARNMPVTLKSGTPREFTPVPTPTTTSTPIQSPRLVSTPEVTEIATPTPSPEPAPFVAATPTGKNVTIFVKDDRYYPTSNISIEAGDMVIWVNKMDIDYKIVEMDKKIPDIVLRVRNSYIFNTTGNYRIGLYFKPMRGEPAILTINVRHNESNANQ
jgi:hypothetical protein